MQSLLALLEEEQDQQESVPVSAPVVADEGNDDAEEGGDEDDEDDDLDAELEAELDDFEDDDEEEDGEEEDAEDGTETEPPTAPAATPGGIGSSAATPAPSDFDQADQETESDDNKIGEDDIDVDEDDVLSPSAPSMTPQPNTLPMASPPPSALTGTGFGETGMRDDDEDDQEPEALGEMAAIPLEGQKRKQQHRQDDGCQMTTEEIERIFDLRQKNESRIADHFDLIQMERYERFKRSKIKPASMKKVSDALLGKATHPNVVTALCGVTKMFVGELVETARRIAARGGNRGPLQPLQIYEALEVMQAKGSAAPPRKRRRLFR